MWSEHSRKIKEKGTFNFEEDVFSSAQTARSFEKLKSRAQSWSWNSFSTFKEVNCTDPIKVRIKNYHSGETFKSVTQIYLKNPLRISDFYIWGNFYFPIKTSRKLKFTKKGYFDFLVLNNKVWILIAIILMLFRIQKYLNQSLSTNTIIKWIKEDQIIF